MQKRRRITQQAGMDSKTETTDNSPLDLQGNIENFKLPDIFQLLSHSRKSGTLGIQRDETIVMVYFQAGQIVYGYGPRQAFHLGQLLKERGRITAGQLSKAVAEQNENPGARRLGQILIDMSFVDRADIIEVVQEQVEELLYSLLAWEKGSFKFYENQFPTEEEITADISTENIILEGLRRLDEMNHLRDTLPDMNTALSIAQAATGHGVDIALAPEEWNLLALIDGRRTIKDIVEISNLSEVDTLKKLAALKLAGLIGLAGNGGSGNSKETEEMEGSERLEAMMGRLAGMMEEFLQGSSSPSSSLTTSLSSAASRGSMVVSNKAGRMIGDKPLSAFLDENPTEDSDETVTVTPLTADSLSSGQMAPESGSATKANSPANKKESQGGDKLWNEFSR